MNSNFHPVFLAHPAGQISALAVLFALSGCASSVTPRALPASHVIAAADLPGNCNAPRVVRAVAPAFPSHMRSAGIEGEVRLTCLIDEKGEVRHIALAEASDLQFVDPARQALQKWKFTPGSRDGQPAAMSIVVPIKFIFDDTEGTRKPDSDIAMAPAAGL